MQTNVNEQLLAMRKRMAEIDAEIAEVSKAFLSSPEGAVAFQQQFAALEKLLRFETKDPTLPRKLESARNVYALYFDDGPLSNTVTFSVESAQQTQAVPELVVQLWKGKVKLPLTADNDVRSLRRRRYVLALSPRLEFGWRHRLDLEEWLDQETFLREALRLHREQYKNDAMLWPHVRERLQRLQIV